MHVMPSALRLSRGFMRRIKKSALTIAAAGLSVAGPAAGNAAPSASPGDGARFCGHSTDGLPDGCAGSPAGAPQYPSLFSAPLAPHPSPYPVRPPWNVAGVDYHVGVPSEVSLTDFHADGALPACASLHKPTGRVVVTSAPCQLSGIDFSGHGGACVYIAPQAGPGTVTIANSRFSVGTASACKGAYLVAAGKGFAGTFQVESNIFLGNGPTSQSMSAAIGSAGSGPVFVRYNYITQLDQHGIDFAAPPSSISVLYNVITNFGMETGSHPNFAYFCGGTFANVEIAFNLSAEFFGEGAQAGAQGMTIHADSGCGSNLIDPIVTHNVVLNPGTGAGAAQTASYVIAPTQDSGATLSGANISHNYIDWSGGYGPMYPSKGTAFVCSRNIDIYRGNVMAGTFGNVICN